jgi:hypothetical protein
MRAARSPCRTTTSPALAASAGTAVPDMKRSMPVMRSSTSFISPQMSRRRITTRCRVASLPVKSRA